MNKQLFSDIISNPELLIQVETEDIESIIDQFPYCQITHLLLAKKLKQDKSILFEGQLNLSAAYAPSRKVLHELIQGSSVIANEEIEFTGNESIMRPVIEENIEIITSSEEDQKLDALIQSELSANYNIGEADPIEKEEKEEDVDKISKNEKQTFSGWMKILEEGAVITEKSSDEIIDKFIKDEPRIGEIKFVEASTENLAKNIKDDFDTDLVTETLAKIHIDQGNRILAIEIYEQLILKYPEKRPYFAAQINFIKK